ncbi:unnamed protein product [Didymodactylos carnosus]|uniref:C2H2-type domain-containing protein n=1 Tax=Didymodactylos carnosus TaxID=1234261 RepID=A0A813ZDK0_9BILA|nr:unnamed protein product [Didymodactylos carnosus]CAF0896765.1 unnamed protein product [Didymodactylos carnosus]CAF3638159.1 unnamed protein product [Didymodactylos carnosus]CAF3679939.1 unnamed protein product [Didymodactylos carnosus]
MSDATAYICPVCVYNSDNLEDLEAHLSAVHECSETSKGNKSDKVEKRSLSVDQYNEVQPMSLLYDETNLVTTNSVKRVKRELSAVLNTTAYINLNDDESSQLENEEGEDEEEEVGENDDGECARDEAKEEDLASSRLTCPICQSTYRRIGHLRRHMERKHNIETLTANSNDLRQQQMTYDTNQIKEQSLNMTTDPPSTCQTSPPSGSDSLLINDSITECPYCEYKTNDIEQFKLHIAAHIRDKNYRCLLCNRLYKYRGDCSFHIRRKHHRYSTNSNDYIQRFLFDTADDETNNNNNNNNINGTANSNGNDAIGIKDSSANDNDLSMPSRYFGCPYCDYTSNYGGDVRKHQARKHPNFESKVTKIIRQEQQQQNIDLNGHESDCQQCGSNDDERFQQREIGQQKEEMISNETVHSKGNHKIKKRVAPELFVQSMDQIIQQTKLPLLSNYAPVRVFQCSCCHQQGTYKWVVERHIRAKHPDMPDVKVIELPAELAVKLQRITPSLKRFRCSLCPLQSKHTWVIIRHIKHFHTLQTATVLDILPENDTSSINPKTTKEQFSYMNEEYSDEKVVKQYNTESNSSSVSSTCTDTELKRHLTSSTSNLMKINSLENELNGLKKEWNDDMNDEEEESDSGCFPIKDNSTMKLEQTNFSATYTHQCSLCEYQSNLLSKVQQHLQEQHGNQTGGHVLTHCTSTNYESKEIRPYQQSKTSAKKSIYTKNDIMITTAKGITRSLSPSSALAKAKFSPAVEEALLSLQGSKSSGLYVVQPKFGIKRLKCRHCFYRSNWKTDMIRHVRIRHNMTEPDHNKDMIMMTETEARSTIETYENTFGKELRRRTFRTWQDWAKAEQEFTPKDGSLQYAINSNLSAMEQMNYNGKPHNSLLSKSNSKKTIVTHNVPLVSSLSSNIKHEPYIERLDDNIKRRKDYITTDFIKNEFKQEPPDVVCVLQQHPTQIYSTMPKTSWNDPSLKQLPNYPSNIVSRLLLSSSSPPLNFSSQNDDSADVPLDLSLKTATTTLTQSDATTSETSYDVDISDNNVQHQLNDQLASSLPRNFDSCSLCPFQHRNPLIMERHLSLHLYGKSYQCSLCNYTSKLRSTIQKHCLSTHPDQQVKILQTSRNSNARMKSPSSALNHDTDDEEQICSICPYKCYDRQLFEKHLKHHKQLLKYKCNHCSYYVNHERMLKQHELLHMDNSGNDGDQFFNSNSDLEENDDEIEEQEDINTSHKPTSKKLAISGDDYECPLCGKQQTNLEQFTLHLHSHNQNNNQCPFCSYLSPSNNLIIEHIKLHFNGHLTEPDLLFGIERVKELLEQP